MAKLKKRNTKSTAKVVTGREHKRLAIIKKDITAKFEELDVVREYVKSINSRLIDINICKRCNNIIEKRYSKIASMHETLLRIIKASESLTEPTKDNFKRVTVLVETAERVMINLRTQMHRTTKQCLQVFESLLHGHIDYKSFAGYMVTSDNKKQRRVHMLYMSKYDVMRRFGLTKRQLRGIINGESMIPQYDITKIGVNEFLSDVKQLITLYTNVVDHEEQLLKILLE